MKIAIEKYFDIVPTWNGNNDDSEPITFQCQALTEQQRERVIKIEYKNGEPLVDIKRSMMFELSVKSIQNLEVNGEMITTAKKFLETPLPVGLFDEVASEIALRTMRPSTKN